MFKHVKPVDLTIGLVFFVVLFLLTGCAGHVEAEWCVESTVNGGDCYEET